jgi:putative phosphoesterase
MRIGIISDTHGSLSCWQKVMSTIFQDVDLIIHAGDLLYHGPRNPLPEDYQPRALAEAVNNLAVPLVIVRGNCDAEVDQMMIHWPLQSPYAFIQIENLRILVNHGHTLSLNEREAQAQKYKVHLFVFGHTHIPLLEKREGVIYLNPGSLSLPKDNWEPTVALLENGVVHLISVSTGNCLQEAGFSL